jgi:hypothetical protein
MLKLAFENFKDFELRSEKDKKCYSNRAVMISIMPRSDKPVNIEEHQELNQTIAERLAQALDSLTNLED